MIKVLEANYNGNFEIALTFSDNSVGIFDGKTLLKHQGPLLDALREEAFFKRFFIDMGALCWPNGLELSPAKLRDRCMRETA
jgi:hypothetical protein